MFTNNLIRICLPAECEKLNVCEDFQRPSSLSTLKADRVPIECVHIARVHGDSVSNMDEIGKPPKDYQTSKTQVPEDDLNYKNTKTVIGQSCLRKQTCPAKLTSSYCFDMEYENEISQIAQ